MRHMNKSVVPGLIVAAAVAFAATARAEEPNGPFENIKFTSLSVKWQYSKDGGKTFSDKPCPPPPPGSEKSKDNVDTSMYQYVWKGTLEIADPAKVAGAFVRICEDSDDPRASICNGDIVAASGGYWKDLGFCPTLLDAVIKVNGKEIELAHGPLLQFWVPLSGLKQGANTIEISGHVYTYWGGAAWTGLRKPPTLIDAKIVAAEPQPANIYNGPILGDTGEGYFTFACRTQLPAELTIEATSTEPARPTVKTTAPVGIWHRVKIELPKDTRKVSYTVSAKVGDHVTKRGPYAVALPGKEFRFVALGNMQQHPVAPEELTKHPWAVTSRLVLKAQPNFVLNTGNLMEQESWSFNLEAAYAAPAAEMLARVPHLVTPCNRDWTGIFNELHVTPAADTFAHNWTKVVGPVRFIGIEGNEAWKSGGANTQWLEGVLSQSKDKFIVVLCGYPAYTSGINSKRIYGGRLQTRDVIMPLLDKYKATMMLSSWDPTYERIEPQPGKGCTQIVTGCSGWKSWHKWDGRFGSHEQGPTGPTANARGTSGKQTLPDGREWCGYFGPRHFCVFDVTDSAIRMQVLATGGNADADIKGLKVLDEKTFKPRN
ncbi:MAG: hypothetical protein ABFD92_12960 [Planctomycetaceae bacterium]|nr:hypothetical protein [Planctomycetaceae bacterium]